ncbi:hypothetical protein QJS66_19755 [Kocuria rhizophila]|nr:hypothetical protein QJS66_19755 [Kocuria rhizophila]
MQTVIRSPRRCPEFTDYRGYAGQIASGTVAVGDSVAGPAAHHHGHPHRRRRRPRRARRGGRYSCYAEPRGPDRHQPRRPARRARRGTAGLQDGGRRGVLAGR